MCADCPPCAVPVSHADHPLTASAAQSLQDTAVDAHIWLVWFVSAADPAHPGKVTARAHTADHHGGTQLPGVFVADTLDELRTMMSAGVARRDRAPIHPADVVETWD